MGRMCRVSLLLVAGLGLLWGCGGGDGATTPPPPPPPAPPPAPVASVTVTPPQATILPNGSVQLSAQPRDASGNNLNRAVVWQTLAPAVASVSTNGLVTGLTPGNATITATSEGQVGQAAIAVQNPPPVSITQVAPAVMVEGQATTITGAGFSATPGGNVVRIGGAAATVVQATTTQLQVTVPSGICLPKGAAVPVQVSVGTVNSNIVQHPLNPAAFLNLAVGEQVVMQGSSDRCLQFDAAAGAERYVVGVQSVSSVAATLTGVRVQGDIPGGAGPAPPLEPVLRAAGPGGPMLSPAETRGLDRWEGHVAATAVQYERDRVLLQNVLDRSGGPRMLAHLAAAPSVPGTVQEGQTVEIRVPLLGTGSTCANFVTINAKVRKITDKAIFVEDEANPEMLPEAVFDQAGAAFGPIHDLNVEHFGPVGDLDQNQRLVIVVTREVNKVPSILGFVFHGNLLLSGQCASSNEGELFYMRSPDPTGMFVAGVYTLDNLVQDFDVLLIHEFAHNIQGARRMAAGGQFMVSWMAEGLATMAQEVVGMALLGLQPGQNYGPNRVYTTFGADQRRPFTFINDLFRYFGFNFQGGHVPGAPEECTWVGTGSTGTGNPGPCSTATRLVYGLTWSLIRQSIDRHFPGAAAQKQIFRAFSDYAGAPGFPALEAVLGRPVATLMAEWAPMLHIDDRYAGAGQFQFANWNIRAIAAAWQSANAELLPRMRGFMDFTDDLFVRAGSTAFWEVSGANRPGTAIRVRDQTGGPAPSLIQIWAVRVQ